MQTDPGTNTSYLTKLPVVLGLLALCIVSAAMGKTGMALLLAFLFALTGASWLWARFAMRQVECEVSAPHGGVFPGGRIRIVRTVRNRKGLPLLWAEIREDCTLEDPALPAPDRIFERRTVEADADERETRTVISYARLYALGMVRPWRTVRIGDEWEARRRGVMELGATEVRSGDGFGLSVATARFAAHASRRVTVFPCLADVDAAPILKDIWEARAGAAGALTDHTLVKSVRDYLPGDAAREINMRMLARGQGLKTNLYEIVAPQAVLFVLDAASWRAAPAEDFERALSVLATLLVRLTEKGMAVSLLAPASAWFPETLTAASAGEEARLTMLELLAAASAQGAVFSRQAPLPADEPGRVYYVASDADAATSPWLCGAFPAHKLRFLIVDPAAAGSAGAAAGYRIR
ncbi:MAG: DUF58 domain-containing protein [Clostridiales Family XIII bacterium]|nr:DUF58 domain-containing protein [Clostridiales Family XIII bacterium]